MLYKHIAICTQLHNITAHALHTNSQVNTQNYLTLLHILYTHSHGYMHTITQHYCTCCTHKPTAACTELHNITAHAVHTNTAICTQLYNITAHAVQKTQSYMHTIK